MGAHRRIVVIGGGPAGVQAALAAAGSGQQVTIISDGPPGGRAAWQTLLPSKMWLGATPGEPLRLADLRERYEQVAGAWQRQILEQLEQAGATLMLGSAAFLSPHEIAVTPPEGGYPDQLSADAIIIATGAVPFVPPGLEPDGVRVFSPHRVWDMTKLPDDMIVIGAGGPATEYVDAFSRLGARITWITGPVGVLSAFPPDAGRFISAVMEKRGVQIITGLVARQIERGESGVRVITSGRAYEASAAFVAIGLRPDLKRLNLEAAGLRAGTSGSLVADLYGRTAQPHIYLAGDAASPISANIAIAQGRMAGWHAAGVEIGPTTMETGVMAIYTSPQVALVGHMTERGAAIQKVRVPFHACLRAHLMRPHSAWQEATGMHPDTEQEGFLEVAFAAEAPRRITGALAVCPEAAEVLTPLAVAVRAGMTVDELAGVYAGHPTFSELAILAARMAR
jgi:dihydrolipoamide dehydrogenase